MLQDSLSNPGLGICEGPTQSANGVQVGDGNTQQGGGYIQAPPNTLQFDVRTNATLCVPNPQWGENKGVGGDWRYKYDGAGRQTDAYAATKRLGLHRRVLTTRRPMMPRITCKQRRTPISLTPPGSLWNECQRYVGT